MTGEVFESGPRYEDTRRILLLMSAIWMFLFFADILIGVLRPWVGTSDYPPASHARNAALWLGAWMALTPVIVAWSRRVHPARIGWGRSLFAHAVALPIFIATHLAIVSLVFDLLVLDGSGEDLVSRWQALLFATTSRDMAVYAVVAGVFHLLDASTRRRAEATRAAQLEAEGARLRELAAEARLEALRRELDPHFVANALNSVATCVREGGRDRALRMLEAIGNLLRASFRKDHDARVTLAEELDLLELYVGIERVRVGDRMSFEIDTEPRLLDALVPTLILQPLVENAVRHAVDRHVGPVAIQVEVRTDGDSVCIAVHDRASKPAPTRSQDDTERTGLANARERLHLLYGARASLRVHLDQANGASVEISIPHEHAEVAEGGPP